MISNDGQKFELNGNFPRETIRLFSTNEGVLAATRRGKFYRYQPQTNESNVDVNDDSAEEAQVETADQEPENAADQKTEAQPSELFVGIGPQTANEIRNESLVAVNRSNSEIAIYNRKILRIYKLVGEGDSEKYAFDRSIEIETGTRPNMSCHIAYQGDHILLVLGNGQVILIDGETLKEKKGYLPNSRFAADSVTASADGRWFAVCYRNETVWLLDTQDDSRMYLSNVRGQGSISAVAFTDNKMLVADRTDRVTAYDLDSFSSTDVYSPAGSALDNAWRYGIKPLYFAFPKPGEFYKVVSYLSSSSDTSTNLDVDLAFQEPTPNPWSPLTSGLVFMGVMLFISCIVFMRTDY